MKEARAHDEQGFWSRLACRISKAAKELFGREKTQVVDENQEYSDMGIFTRLVAWTFFKSKFPVSIEKAVTFRRFEQHFDLCKRVGLDCETSYELELTKEYVYSDDSDDIVCDTLRQRLHLAIDEFGEKESEKENSSDVDKVKISLKGGGEY